MSGDAIGMMEGAYFVSRSSLLAWLNALLRTDYEKVESVCTGVPHLQVLDALFPGEVPLHKANLNANPALDYECLANWKLVQDVFTRKNLGRVLPVQKLVKGRYQDNLEILQWMKSYFDKHWVDGQTYDAASRREEAQRQHMAARQKRRGGPLRPVDGNAPTGISSPAAKSTPMKTPRKLLPDKPNTPRAGSRRAAATTTPRKLFAAPAPGATETIKTEEATAVAMAESSAPAPHHSASDELPLAGPRSLHCSSDEGESCTKRRKPNAEDTSEADVGRLQAELQQSRLAAHVKDKQAMFYCSKLRDIAMAVKSFQRPEDAENVIHKIQAILSRELAMTTERAESPAPLPPCTM